jgi:hypothetical protein
MAHRWHECRKWITSRLASIRPEDLQGEGLRSRRRVPRHSLPQPSGNASSGSNSNNSSPNRSSSSSSNNNRNNLPEAKPLTRKTKGARSNSSNRCRTISPVQRDRRGKRIELGTSFPTPCKQRSGTSTTFASFAEEDTGRRCALTSSIGPQEDCMRWQGAEGE